MNFNAHAITKINSDIFRGCVRLEPSEHEDRIRKNLNGIADKIEGDELAELPDGLRERRQLEMGRVAKFGRNLRHNADFVAVKKQF